MEEKKITSPQIKGLIISLIIIVLGIAGYFTDLAFTSWFNWVVNFVMIVGIIFACVHFAKEKDGYVTFGNVFGHGFKVSMVVAVIILVYSLLSTTFIFPEIKEKTIEMQRAKMEAAGTPDDQIDMAMDFTKKYFMAFMIFGVLIGTLIFGCIASLIGAAVAKKKPINPLTQQGGM
jgi:hypothetical protein